MVYRNVLKWPNELLTEISHEVTTFDDSLQTLVNDMFDTLNVELGAGIAAPQIGVQKRVILLKCDSFDYENCDPYEKDPSILVAVNPVLELSDERRVWQEVCLSVPLVKGTVSRFRDAYMTYQDMHGNKKKLRTGWPLSGALQHECDHLDGILFLDRMPRKESLKAKREIFGFLQKQAKLLKKNNKKEKASSRCLQIKTKKNKTPKKFGKLKKKKK